MPETTKHTPGPWSYDGKFTVGIPHKNGDTYFRTNPEDARLIAAAPELLKSLKQYVDGDTFDWKAARAAIAKATGKGADE